MIKNWKELIEDYFYSYSQDGNQSKESSHLFKDLKRAKEYQSLLNNKKELLAERAIDKIKYKNYLNYLRSDTLEENRRYSIIVQNHQQVNYKQKGDWFDEEVKEIYQIIIDKDENQWLIEDVKPVDINVQDMPIRNTLMEKIDEKENNDDRNIATSATRYDRQKAVDYANRWWNSHNSRFRAFEVDCTNYISQCLWAGGAPMSFSNSRSKGWWYKGSGSKSDNWSYSWAVAHNLRWYLQTSKSGLIATEVDSPDKLMLGDVICYDFNGDGRWQHNTIVTAKDAFDMPLVNAHTVNSKQRHWSYRDSYAYTEKIQYKFFHIHDQF